MRHSRRFLGLHAAVLGMVNCPAVVWSAEAEQLVQEARSGDVAEDGAASDDLPVNDAEEAAQDIIVTAALLRGSVRTAVPVEIRVGRTAILALGADSLADVINSYAPQSRSLRSGEAPIILLDGRRIGSSSEIADIPPEAILSVEIFPEEVALQYGFVPNRRVVNVVLRPEYHVIEMQVRADVPLGDVAGKVQFLDIRPSGRVNLVIGYQRLGQRVDHSSGSGAEERWEHPASDRFAVNGTFAQRFVGHDVTFTASSNSQIGQFRLGVDSIGAALEGRHTEARQSFGVTIGSRPGHWFWLATGQLRLEQKQFAVTGAGGSFAVVPEYSGTGNTRGLQMDFVGSGPVGDAGGLDLLATVGGGTSTERHDSENPFTDEALSSVRRNSAYVLGSLQLALNGMGDAALSVEVELGTAGGQGILGRYGFGLRAEPARGFTLSTGFSNERALPEFANLAEFQILTPNVRVYDFGSGSSRYIEQRNGGSPQLQPQTVRTAALRMQFIPSAQPNLSVTLDFSDLSIRNGTSGPLMPSPQVEDALPERFTRTSAGLLTRFDRRPINIAQEDRRQLTLGFNLTVPLAGRIPPLGNGVGVDSAEVRPDVPQGGLTPQPSATGSTNAFNGAKLQFGFYHTWTLARTALLAPGLPRIDLLRGAAVRFPGELPQHRVDLQLGYASRHLGLRLTGNWQSASRVAGIVPHLVAGTHSLVVRPPVRLDLRIFIDVAKATQALGAPHLSGRIYLQLDNLMGNGTIIRDENEHMVHYYRDFDRALGRTVHLTFRKLLY